MLRTKQKTERSQQTDYHVYLKFDNHIDRIIWINVIKLSFFIRIIKLSLYMIIIN